MFNGVLNGGGAEIWVKTAIVPTFPKKEYLSVSKISLYIISYLFKEYKFILNRC